jgi:caffeoyl-CoA O-methyltransferase
MAKATGVDPAIQEYIDRHRTPDDPLLELLRKETELRYGRAAGMQISASQGTLMRMLVTLIGARRAVEVGTFTGYSAIEIARGLAPGGTLLCCDRSEEWTALARQFWERAGVADRIELRLAPAADTLRALPAGEWIDFAFIDADKTNYPRYYEELLPRTRRNGLLLFDNALWGGSVLDAQDRSADTEALRQLGAQLAADPRVECTLLPVGDGLLLARKRA